MPRRDYIAGVEAPRDYMGVEAARPEDAISTNGGSREVVSLPARRAGALGAYGFVADTSAEAAPRLEATYGLVRQDAAPQLPVSVLRPVEAIEAARPTEARTDVAQADFEEDDDGPGLRAIEAGDAVAPALEPPAAADHAGRPGPAIGGFFPSPTERVVLPVPQLDAGRSGAPAMLVAAATASIVTGLLSWLVRGPRGS